MFIVSEINEDIVVKNINFEKQMIADMDEDVQEIIRKIFESKNIRTNTFEKTCQLREESDGS